MTVSNTATANHPLGWGQQYVWFRHHHLPPTLRGDANLQRRIDLPPGATTDGVRAMMGHLVVRHQALRTFHLDTNGDPVQIIHRPRPVPVQVIVQETAGDHLPGRSISQMRDTAFDLTREWPIRAAVVTRSGVPRQLILVLCHLAFDAWSVERLEAELSAIGSAVAAHRPVVLPPVPAQPTDLLHYEASKECLRRSAVSTGFWRDRIAALPTDVFGRRRRTGVGDDAQRSHSTTITSPPALAAVRTIAAAHGWWTSAVHTAALSAAVAEATGIRRFPLLSHVGHRAAIPFPEVLTCAFTPLPVLVDHPTEATFLDLAASLSQAADDAAAHAHFPFDELLELVRNEAVLRARPLRLGAELGFLSHPARVSGARRTRVHRGPAPVAWACTGMDFFARVFELRDAVAVTLHCSAEALGPDEAENILKGYEWALLSTAAAIGSSVVVTGS